MQSSSHHLCPCKTSLDFAIKMAFQPIVNVESEQVVSYEALVRGSNGESAAQILNAVNQDNKYSFDQCCRVTAIETFSNV